MKLILINGQSGAGKTSVAKALLRLLENSAYIETDSLVAVNPFEYNDQLQNLATENAISLLNNFNAADYENIIIAGLIKDQNQFERLQSKLPSETEVNFVWLRATEEIRRERKQERDRDEADSPEHFDFIDELIPDVKGFELKNAKYIEIETSLIHPGDIALQIQAEMI